MANGNMANISSTISINISRNPGTIENVYIGVDFYRLIFSNIPSYSRNFMIFLLGLMMRFQVLTLGLSNMRLRLTPMLSLFDNIYAP